MIIRGALLAALLLPTMASAQSRCAGIAALTGADGRQLRDIGLREGRSGGIGFFAGRRQAALPDAENCTVDLAEDGAREFTCYYRSGPISAHGKVRETSLAPHDAFEQVVSTLRDCMQAPLSVDAQRAPLYTGATDVFALRRASHRIDVPGGAVEIGVRLIESTGDHGYIYATVSFEFEADDD